MDTIPSLSKRVTQGDVARVAGVHNTTVSLALRNCPSIPEGTRLRIRTLAEQMGYCPDPTLQALVAYRRGCRVDSRSQTLAYVTDGLSRSDWRDPAAERTFRAAQRKAEALGYQLEHFWLAEPGMSARRLSNVLYHRSISGAIIAAQRNGDESWADLDWSRLSAVQIGTIPHEPSLHRVVDDCHGMVQVALRRARAAGYRRIGFVFDPARDTAADHAFTAGYLVDQAAVPGEGRLQPLAYRSGESRRVLSRWLDEQRPDAIIGLSPSVPRDLAALDLVVPHDLAYIDLGLAKADGAIAGTVANSESVGEVAVAILAAQLQQNALGLPAVPTTTLVAGRWADGASLPAGEGGMPTRAPASAEALSVAV